MASLSQLFGGHLRGRIAQQTTQTERRQAEALRDMLEQAVEPAAQELTAILTPIVH